MLAYTLEKNIISITDAEKGVDYLCPDCSNILRVKDGEKNVKHFFHLDAENCGGTGESLLHKYWKDKISKMKKWEEYDIVESKTELRTLDGSYIPDIVFKTNSGEFVIVEVCYKNPKTSKHKKLYKELGWLSRVYEVKISEKNGEIESRSVLYDKKTVEKTKKEFLKNLEVFDWLSKDKTLKKGSSNFYFTESKERVKEKIVIEHEYFEDVEKEVYVDFRFYEKMGGKCFVVLKGKVVDFSFKDFDSKRYKLLKENFNLKREIASLEERAEELQEKLAKERKRNAFLRDKLQEEQVEGWHEKQPEEQKKKEEFSKKIISFFNGEIAEDY